jgi:hypothetical protein
MQILSMSPSRRLCHRTTPFTEHPCGHADRLWPALDRTALISICWEENARCSLLQSRGWCWDRCMQFPFNLAMLRSRRNDGISWAGPLGCGSNILQKVVGVLRGATYDPGHWTYCFCWRGFVVSVFVPLMLAVLPCERSRVRIRV